MRTLHNIEIVAIIVVVIIGSAAMTAMVVNGLHSSPARASTTNTLEQMIKFERHVDDLRYDVQRFDRLLDVMHDEAILLRLVMEIGSPQDAVIPSNATCVNDAGAP